MDLAVHLGGTNAAPMVRKQQRITVPLREWSLGAKGSIAAAGGSVHEIAGNLLITVGTPIHLAPPEKIVDVASAIHFLTAQDGAFASIFWSSTERKLVVVTDFLGFQPLYARNTDREFQLATNTRAWNRDPDPAAWGAFIALGHTIGARTLLDGVLRVEQATVLVHDLDTDRTAEHKYWQWPERPGPAPESGELIGALADSVRDYAAYGLETTLLLSGGFDSRLIACLLKRLGVSFGAMIVNHEDQFFDADGRLAKTYAKKAGIPFCRMRSPADFFSTQAYLDYVFDSDGATPSLYLFIAQVAQFIDCHAVWEGTIPGATLSGSFRLGKGFSGYLPAGWEKPDSPVWKSAKELFSDEFFEQMFSQFTKHLAAETDRYPDNSTGIARFIVDHHTRNRTAINPLKVYSRRARIFLPGMTRTFIELADRTPKEFRASHQLSYSLLKDHLPEALCCPILSGSTLIKPGSASASYYLNKLLSEVHGFSKKYPGLARWARMGSLGQSFQESVFADPGHLIDDEDRCLDRRKIRATVKSNSLSTNARKILFHWKEWRRIHSGTPEIEKAVPSIVKQSPLV